MKRYPIPIVAFAVAVACVLTGGSATAAGVAHPTKEVSVAGKNPKIEAINRFFAAYAAQDMDGIRSVLTENVEWSIPGHHPLSGTKRGVEEVVAFFTELVFLSLPGTPRGRENGVGLPADAGASLGT